MCCLFIYIVVEEKKKLSFTFSCTTYDDIRIPITLTLALYLLYERTKLKMYFAIQKLPEIDCDCFNLMVGLLDFSSSYMYIRLRSHFKCIEKIFSKNFFMYIVHI